MLRKLFTTPLRCLTSYCLAATMGPKKKRALAQDTEEEETATVPAKKPKTATKATKTSRTKKGDAEGEYFHCSARLVGGRNI